MGKQLHVEMSSKELIPWDLKNILASILYFIKYDKIIHKELFFKLLIMAGFLFAFLLVLSFWNSDAFFTYYM